jgi:DNA-binding NarL/FixJ family response regulator
MERLKLLLVEPHQLVSQGLRALLEPEHSVVAIIHDATLALPAVNHHQPDLVLLDLPIPGRGGLGVLAGLTEAHPALPVVVLAAKVHRGLADQVFRLGARGLLSKDASLDELRHALAEALAGRRFQSPAPPGRPLEVPARRPRFAALTPRQQEILRLIGRGFTSEQISAALSISHWTVHYHRKNIRRQLRIQTDWEMIRYASRIVKA